MIGVSDTPPFPETSYGVVKRLHVVSAWVAAVSKELGKPELRVLDYGCGTGDHLAAPLARLGHCVVGADVHAPSIDEARRRHQVPSLSFKVADVAALVTEAPSFDVVICSEVLEHIDHPGPFLLQLRRLLVRNGALVITTPNGYGSFELLSSLERLMRRAGLHHALRSAVWSTRRAIARAKRTPPPSRPLEYVASADAVGFINFDSGHVQFFRLDRLERLFRDAGLCVAARRARTLLCGPYADAMFALAPRPATLLRWNDRAADVLPFGFAADWMFLLRPEC